MANKDADQVQRIMSSLKVSETEAREIMEYDRKVDKAKDGEVLPYDLTTEQNEVARKFAHTGTRKAPTAYKLPKKERKPNEPKREIIQILEEALNDYAQEITVTNQERQIDFTHDNVKYRIVLSAPRK